jgi:CRP/FNR family transcriptional regulator, cyclic AMP receptor protein
MTRAAGTATRERSLSALAATHGLRRVKLLEGLPAAALESIAGRCRWRRYSAGQQIISRESPDSDVFFVVSGRVRVTAFSAAGRQVTYGDMEGGDCFGDFAAIDGLSRSADVLALEETLVAAVAPADFRRLLHEQPLVCERMLLRLVQSVRELTDRVFAFSTLGVQNRVHAEILRLARRAGIEDNAARIDPAPKHGDIAGRISTYREQVTRELSRMVKQSLVVRDGRALVIPNVERLERLVAEVHCGAQGDAEGS